MMKTTAYKPGILFALAFFVLPLLVSAEEVTKNFHKEYKATPSTLLDLNNRYGDIVIHSSNTDQIVIDVIVTVELPNKEKAEKLLSYIDVQFSESDNKISAKTVIDEKFSFSGWGGDNKRFTINYNVKMPVGTDLNLANKYGNTDFDELHGLLNLDIKYGNLTAGKMTRGNVKPWSKINIAYGKCSVSEAGWLDLYMRYAGRVDIEKGQALLLDSRYSRLEVAELSSMVGDSKYDNVRIGKINNLVLENGYTDTNIGTLTKKLSYKGSYGSFTVENVPAGFETIDTDTRYMGVRLGIDPAASYKLEAKVSYGGLKYNEDSFKNERRIIENTSSEISGIMGSAAAPSSEVKVVASYGSVKLD